MRGQDRTISRVQIANSEGLQEFCSDLHREYGSDARAAEELGLTRDTFRNLRTGRVTGSMDYDTYASITAALGGEAREFGRGLRPSPFEAELRNDEDDPTAIYRRERAKGRGPHDTGDDQGLPSRGALETYQLFERFMDCVVVEETHYVWSHYEQWMTQELRRIRPRAEPIFRRLWEQQAYKRRFQDFLERVGRPRDQVPSESDLRCWLAIYRAVEPFADTKDTWGIERTWEELAEAGELRAYFKAALKRERLLLHPPDDVTRVQRGSFPRDDFEEDAGWDAFVEDNRYYFWLYRELHRLRGERYWRAFAWLWKRPTYRKVIEEHLMEATGSTDLPPRRYWRHWLALLRPLEALTPRTGGVERSCWELDRDNQLETYLKDALSNERILLDRDPAPSRIEDRRMRDAETIREQFADFIVDPEDRPSEA